MLSRIVHRWHRLWPFSTKKIFVQMIFSIKVCQKKPSKMITTENEHWFEQQQHELHIQTSTGSKTAPKLLKKSFIDSELPFSINFHQFIIARLFPFYFPSNFNCKVMKKFSQPHTNHDFHLTQNRTDLNVHTWL